MQKSFFNTFLFDQSPFQYRPARRAGPLVIRHPPLKSQKRPMGYVALHPPTQTGRVAVLEVMHQLVIGTRMRTPGPLHRFTSARVHLGADGSTLKVFNLGVKYPGSRRFSKGAGGARFLIKFFPYFFTKGFSALKCSMCSQVLPNFTMTTVPYSPLFHRCFVLALFYCNISASLHMFSE